MKKGKVYGRASGRRANPDVTGISDGQRLRRDRVTSIGVRTPDARSQFRKTPPENIFTQCTLDTRQQTKPFWDR